ncbi:ABC transporter substrate-binding protein [Rhodoflexus sp.]
MKFSFHIYLIISFIACFSLSGCKSKRPQDDQNLQISSTQSVRYANFFSIEEQQGYTLLRVTPFEGKQIDYAIYPKDKPLPKLPQGCQPIAAPIERVALYGTTYAHLFEIIGCQSVIKAFAGSSYLFSERLRAAVANGQIAELGSGSQPNVELLSQLKPDVVMLYAGASDANKLSLLQRTGIKVLINADFMENNPLGKAEWVKVAGLLCNKSKKADSIFNQIEEKYMQLAAKTRNVQQRPTVFPNVPYGNTWYMPGGDSFMAKLLQDAGANYLWQDEKQTGSLPLSLEAAFSRIQTADYWINPGSMESLDMIRKTDTRFGLLKAVQSGRVFNNNKRQLPQGGNDYWESGSVRPDLVLADLIAIFHPDILPNHEFVYFQRLQ